MLKRYFITVTLALIAGYIGYTQYCIYTANPWTRDGQVRAYVIQVTPRVTGQVTNIEINDNVLVNKGDLLFEIDDSIYQVNLKKAQAALKQSEALVKKAKNEAKRSFELVKITPGAVPVLTLNNLTNAIETAEANRDVARASVDDAKLNLSFTKVYAPTDGYITNFNLREGSQVVANTPVVALIDKDSFWVEGFFKETDLNGVDPQDKAYITLLMHNKYNLEGKIESIGYGIAKSDGSTSTNLLPTVNPNFQWIRLAQRIPVKIKLTNIPEDLQLRVGMTASVKIIKGE
ncbi:efflux transporter periplasmic adaptor subunit [Vibrio sp. 10N.286.49.B3]|uniref:HlyD family secretion protein n=1 Tax=Vibrio sp. 10N.286.49.B3 TaxID=1880855 RepID=UPI000C844C8B|nr:HlyD family secretion protein [Vibrio sp. 10N.286.49.B3]PMH43121.1 efflux transporter periplasmic adaptor subunit [Vibrio sp. 10N.286.49.B3]